VKGCAFDGRADGEEVALIHLTSDGVESSLRVALISRYPPSVSGAAGAASHLVERLIEHLGVRVEVVRIVESGEPSAVGLPVVMEVDSRSPDAGAVAAWRANRSDIAVAWIDDGPPTPFLVHLLEHAAVPVVLLIDEVASSGSLSQWGPLFGKAAAVVVRSRAASTYVGGAAADDLRIEVVPHGSPFPVVSIDRTLRRRILTWGFLGPGAGVERVIRALPLLADMDPVPRYRLIGAGDPRCSSSVVANYRDELGALADDLGVATQVEFVPGYRTHDALVGELATADVVAVVYDEVDRTASRILTETIGAGKPVVATRFPGAVEALRSGAGTVVAHEDDDGLASALRRYLEDDSSYGAAVRAARGSSVEHEWDAVAGAIFAVLARVVSGGKITVTGR
jgi:glycosyltransferase involved in cell wall biosynthesis